MAQAKTAKCERFHSSTEKGNGSAPLAGIQLLIQRHRALKNKIGLATINHKLFP